LREAGLDVDDKLIFQAGRTIEEGAKAASQMLSESSDATAVQAVNDMVAVGSADTLLNHGLKIPRTCRWPALEISSSQTFRVSLTTRANPSSPRGDAVETHATVPGAANALNRVVCPRTRLSAPAPPLRLNLKSPAPQKRRRALQTT